MKIDKRSSADFIRMPWKNGGGETLQMAIEPPGAGLDDFDWRVSSATLERDGPFSPFPGMDRSLALLDGGALRLYFAEPRDAWPAELDLRPGERLADFAGELAIEAHLTGEPACDFNIMTRRGMLRHRLMPFNLHGEALRGDAHWLLYLTEGALRAGDVELSAGELLNVQSDDDGPLTLAGEARGWLVLLDAA
jgi:uncharacterized protein